MNGLIEGLMRFVAKDGEALTTLQSVAAMVTELEKLGASPVVSVTVELGADSRKPSNSTPIIVGTGSYGPDAWRISSEQVRMLSGQETPFSPVGLVTVVSASPVLTNSPEQSGEDFLSSDTVATTMPAPLPMEIDWSGLTPEENRWRQRLEEGLCTLLKVPASAKRAMAWEVLRQIPLPRKQWMFEQTRPEWMRMRGSDVTRHFKMSWSELVQHVQDGDRSIVVEHPLAKE